MFIQRKDILFTKTSSMWHSLSCDSSSGLQYCQIKRYKNTQKWFNVIPFVQSTHIWVDSAEDSIFLLRMSQQGKQCFQRWNRCVRFKVVRLSSLIPLDLRHAEQLLFLCPCSNLTVYKGSIFDHPLCASLSCLQYGI